MKRIVGIMVVVVMVFSMSISAFAAGSAQVNGVNEEQILRAISALNGDFQNEAGCSTEVVCAEVDGGACRANEYMNGLLRGTTVPTIFYNIAQNGIYKGAFSNLRGTMYTSKYFDMQNGAYYSRVRCYGAYPNLMYKAGNYCITCERVLSTTESDYSTPPTPYEYGSWVSLHHTVSSSHADHFMCPFVVNTSGLINDQLYAIGGDLWVNYTNSWN